MIASDLDNAEEGIGVSVCALDAFTNSDKSIKTSPSRARRFVASEIDVQVRGSIAVLKVVTGKINLLRGIVGFQIDELNAIGKLLIGVTSLSLAGVVIF